MSEIAMAVDSRPRSFVWYLILTALVCGALVMVIEVLGSRVIGPFFGVSLFVWTSLITVTLVALAAGYAVGGHLADRRDSPVYLYGIILTAGLLTLLIPFLRAPVLKTCLSLGLRTGAFASASLLFGPTLFLLGCVSPYIIRIAAREMRNIGRTVGVFYAISTVGSFVGTVCTGFVLIAFFRVDQIFLVVGMLLVALAAGYFALFRKKALLLVFLLLPVFMLFQGGESRSATMPDGTKATELFAKETFYGQVKVVEYSLGAKRTRELMLDGLIQGGIDTATGLSVYEYPYYLQYIPYLLNPRGKSCLMVGLGAGVIPTWYESMGIRTDVVDIDPEVVRVARDYFGFRVSGEVVISDARYYLNTTAKKYDYVILDVFSGDTTPGHVLSREALEVIRERLSGQGIVAVNLIGSIKHETFMTASIIRTIKEVFPYVRIYTCFDQAEGDGAGNLAVIASRQPQRDVRPEEARQFPVHPMAASVRQIFGMTFRFPEKTPAIVLTDNYNPIDFYDVWLKERVRKGIVAGVPFEILL
ncbi:MAG: fused MFS/spermidine synthase [Geobacter sp.]|nr:fused MFS/spermidine synthase [Geobacter sp.]